MCLRQGASGQALRRAPLTSQGGAMVATNILLRSRFLAVALLVGATSTQPSQERYGLRASFAVRVSCSDP